MRTELQSKKDLEYQSLSEPERIEMIHKAAEELKVLDYVSQPVFSKIEREGFPKTAFWREDRIKRKFIKEVIEFCDDGTIYLGETDEGGRPHGYGI